MSNLFQPDSRLTNALNLVFRIMVLNMLTIITCIPILTAGASITAMHSVSLKLVRTEDIPVVKTFLKAFCDEFWKTTILWMIILIVGCLFVWDAYLIRIGLFSFNIAGKIVMVVFWVIYLLISLWIILLQSRYRNRVGLTIKNALYLSIRYLLKTVIMAVIGLLPVIMAAAVSRWSILPVLIGFGLSGFLQAMIYDPIFKQIESRSICEM